MVIANKGRAKPAAKAAGRARAKSGKPAAGKSQTAAKATAGKATAGRAAGSKGGAAGRSKAKAKASSPSAGGTTDRAKAGRARGKRADAEAPVRSNPLGLEVDDEVLEFIEALDRFKHEHNRPFPSWSEVLHVLRELGYRRG